MISSGPSCKKVEAKIGMELAKGGGAGGERWETRSITSGRERISFQDVKAALGRGRRRGITTIQTGDRGGGEVEWKASI